jgi:hypothetical protein
VFCDETVPAAALLPQFAGDDEHDPVEVERLNASEYAQACGALVDLVGDDRLRHLDQPELNAAVKGAAKRPLGDAWAWSRKSSNVDISPLVAVTLALWGLESRAPDDQPLIEVFA